MNKGITAQPVFSIMADAYQRPDHFNKSETAKVYFQPTDEVLNNPYIGFVSLSFDGLTFFKIY